MASGLRIASAGLSSTEASDLLFAADVRLVQATIPDLNGILRGKFIDVETAAGGSIDLSTILYGLTAGGGVALTPFSSYANGFPNFTARIDRHSVARWAWRPEVAEAFFEPVGADGEPCPFDTRQLLKAAERQLRARRFEALFAFEYECIILERSVANAWLSSGFKVIPPIEDSDPFSLSRSTALIDLAEELGKRLASLGIGLKSFHAELGPGAFEFSLAPASPLAAADAAARAKLHLKQLCSERGFAVTFMPKPYGGAGAPTSGGHVHQSLWRDGANLFAGENGGPSALALQYIAGQLRALRDCHLVFRPTINSHRRMDVGSWSPADSSWDQDNRTAALRFIFGAAPTSARVEHRVPGPDANPYLAVALMLAGGLAGIDDGLEAPAPRSTDGQLERLPFDVPSSIEAFAASAFVADTLGLDLARQILAVRKKDLSDFEAWLGDAVTDWELRRYFAAS